MSRIRDLDGDAIDELLRRERVQFVVADVGHPLRWIDLNEADDFWKETGKGRVLVSDRFHLEDFPGEWAFGASRWSDETGARTLVLLERYH